MGWGLDLHWAALAREHGWRCGVHRRRRDPPPRGARRARLLARAGDRRGARVPRRAPLPDRARGRAHPRHPPPLVSAHGSERPRVAVVAEFYPSQRDPVLGVWAHRQALAARDAGAEVRVLVLHRLVPPRASLSAGAGGAGSALARSRAEPRKQTRDGLPVTYVPYVSPPRERAYPAWGAWAAPALALALRRLRALVPVRAGPRPQRRAGRRRGAPARLGACRWSSRCTAATCSTRRGAARRGAGGRARAGRRAAGARQQRRASPSWRAAHGAARDAGGAPRRRPAGVPRRSRTARRAASARHGRPPRRPQAPRRRAARAGGARRAPSRAALRDRRRRAGAHRAGRARRAPRDRRAGRVPRPAATRARRVERARRCTLFVMPSTEEAFGVAYIEAMAGGVPAIGCRGEPGPEEIAAAGDGFMLVPPGDIERLTQRIDELLSRSASPARGRPARARDRRRQLHLGALRRGDARGLPRTRCGEAGPVRHRPRSRLPRGRARAAARARGHRAGAVRRPLAARRRRRSRASCRSRTATCARGELRRAGRERRATARSSAPPAGVWRRWRPGRARAARGVPLILWASLWAHPRSAGARAQLPAAAAPVPLGRRGRHLRPARERLRAGARRAQRARRRRSRSTTTSGAPPTSRRRALPAGPRRRGHTVPVRRSRRAREGRWGCCGGLARAQLRTADGRAVAGRGRPRSVVAAGAADAPGRRSFASIRWRRESCATSTRPATCWSCPRSRPAPFASRGVWLSTRR